MQIKQMMKKHKCSFKKVLQKYDVIESEDDEVAGGFAFCQMLEKLGIISCESKEKKINLNDLRPIYDEYA